MTTLSRYVAQTDYQADNGGHGQQNRRKGTNGEDLILEVPPNTTVHDIHSSHEFTLERGSPDVLLCRGGKGGKGNNAFKSPTHQVPKKATPGYAGQERTYKLTHRLLADIGFVGLPNAGKSSLLNELTAAGARIGAYPFTTLEPNLGAMDGIILADIPGLIEGASSGKGLGTKFLKHISKVTLIVHCISAESQQLEKDYHVVMEELAAYDTELVNKQTVLLLTKHDIISPAEIEEKRMRLKELHPEVFSVSIHDLDSIQKLRTYLLTHR
jgi:GTP-binding protein